MIASIHDIDILDKLKQYPILKKKPKAKKHSAAFRNIIDVVTAFDIETTTFANASTIKNIKQIALGFEDNITRKFFVLAKLCEKYSTNKAVANFKINCKSKELTKNLHQCETNLMLKIVLNLSTQVMLLERQ